MRHNIDIHGRTGLAGTHPADRRRPRSRSNGSGCSGQDVAIEGRFELPPLAQLSAEDQIFVAAFVRCHGSIKQMEKFFGVSYPTIKNRLNRIGAQLPFAEIDPADAGASRPSTARAALDDSSAAS